MGNKPSFVRPGHVFFCRKELDPLLPYCIITFLHPVALYTHYTYVLLTMKQCYVQIVHNFHKTDLS